MAVAPSDSATAHMAAGQGVPLTPWQVAPVLAAGRGWEQPLGVGIVAGKGIGQGEARQILGTQMCPEVKDEHAGLSCRVKTLCFPGQSGQSAPHRS